MNDCGDLEVLELKVRNLRLSIDRTLETTASLRRQHGELLEALRLQSERLNRKRHKTAARSATDFEILRVLKKSFKPHEWRLLVVDRQFMELASEIDGLNELGRLLDFGCRRLKNLTSPEAVAAG